MVASESLDITDGIKIDLGDFQVECTPSFPQASLLQIGLAARILKQIIMYGTL
jgi:hypothetical protein